jgi:broad specificity phosphatase PhoE
MHSTVKVRLTKTRRRSHCIIGSQMEDKMTTTILLVRHGQTDSNISNFYMGRSSEDLNKAGYNQASRLSSRLSSLPVHSVYTSPLRRAHTTAAILVEPHGLKPRVMDELIEVDLGDWQGLYATEIEQRWPEVWRQWRIDPSSVTVPGGESLTQVTERAIRALHRIVASNQGEVTAIVTHEVIIKVLVAHILSAPNHIYRRFDINNASLSVVRIAGGQSWLAGLNDASHLEN